MRRGANRTTLLWALGTSAAFLAACGEATQLLVVVNSDYLVPGELQKVRALVGDGASTPSEQDFTLVQSEQFQTPGTFVLPISFGVSGDPGQTVRVEVLASNGFRDLVSRRAVTRLRKRKLLRLPMFLSKQCENVVCPAGETCTELGCRPEEIDPATLEAIDREDFDPRCDSPETCAVGQRLAEDRCRCESCGTSCAVGLRVAADGCSCEACNPSCGVGQRVAADGCACEACNPSCGVGQRVAADGCACEACNPSCGVGQRVAADGCACEACNPSCGFAQQVAADGCTCEACPAPSCGFGERVGPSGCACERCEPGCGFGQRLSADGCGCEPCEVTCAPDEVLSSTGCACARVVDLATAPADRGLRGGARSRLLGNVVIADVGGLDASPEVVVGENADAAGRTAAGRLIAYEGQDFFSRPSETVPNGALWTVLGRDALDHLGGSRDGRFVSADVTGDGVLDVVVSAPDADGPGNARVDAGEVYVLVGGPSLVGTIDLAAPPSGVLGATIFAASAGDGVHVLAAGDLSGDGVADVVLGVPGEDDPSRGANAGAFVVLLGGPLLASGMDVDLATAMPFAKILGPTPGISFGGMAAIGDLLGDSAPDLVVSTSNEGAGVVWLFEGPLSGGLSALSRAFPDHAYTLRIVGREAFDNYGMSLAIAQVTAGPGRDLVVGTTQLRYGDATSPQLGAVDVWAGPLVPPAGDPTIDLSLGALPDARVAGSTFGDTLGTSLAVGDVNADGFADLVVSSPNADGPDEMRTNAGEVSVFLGREALGVVGSGTVAADVLQVFGAAPLSRIGTHPLNVAVGDLSGDGRADVCLGSPREAQGRVDCFRAR